jgi:hypothetical protein
MPHSTPSVIVLENAARTFDSCYCCYSVHEHLFVERMFVGRRRHIYFPRWKLECPRLDRVRGESFQSSTIAELEYWVNGNARRLHFDGDDRESYEFDDLLDPLSVIAIRYYYTTPVDEPPGTGCVEHSIVAMNAQCTTVQQNRPNLERKRRFHSNQHRFDHRSLDECVDEGAIRRQCAGFGAGGDLIVTQCTG